VADGDIVPEGAHMGDPLPYPGTPRWVKVSGIIAVVLFVLLAIVVFTGIGGPHGPSRHLPVQ
jgi:hypothetical protein